MATLPPLLLELTFPLAIVGYALLGATVVSHAWHGPRRWLHILTATCVLTHVLLVWSSRYAWSLTVAWERNPAGFLIFHTALALILLAALVPLRGAGWCVLSAFLIASAGAVGATFRREEVLAYRWPVLAVLLLVLVSYGRGWWMNRKAGTGSFK